jgi:hypothetical protein
VDKTKRGIKYASENYEYDYIIRPNITSVLDLNALDKYLDTLPKENVYQGIVNQSHTAGGFPYVMGANIIFSKDVAEKLIDVDAESLDNEDHNIGYVLYKLNVPISTLDTKYYTLAEKYTESNIDQIPGDIENSMNRGAFFYRVKNSGNDRIKIDSMYYSQLLSKLYPQIK